jgi:aminopeptidase N
LNLPTHAFAAGVYADATEKTVALISDWFGPLREKAQTLDLPDPSDAPFESGPVFFRPLTDSDFTSGLSAAHQLTHASFSSFRLWIDEGLAHFAQALYIEQQKGRSAALDYMSAHRPALIKMEQSMAADAPADRSLVNTTSDEFYRSKAMSVWWMLRDMIGDSALKKAIAAYRPEQDKEPSYMPRLIAAQTQRDLEWFFDDWVYRDRGLPDFKVESAYSRKSMSNSFMLTVTVENLGSAGAEVPIVVKFAGGAAAKRLEIRAKSKATIRIETPGIPQEITVNDGSVPESDTTNNTVKVDPPQN